MLWGSVVKKRFLYFLILMGVLGSICLAASVEVVGPCSSTPIYSGEIEHQSGESLGAVSIRYLDYVGATYIGGETGIAAIAGSPVDREALEMIDREKMTLRAYGWCVHVNGEESKDKMPNEILLSSGEIKIKWFYAYSLLEAGQWKEYCTPSYLLKSPFICKR